MGVLTVLGAVSLSVAVATVWRIGYRVPPRDLIAVAWATRSARTCLGFIRFCLRP